jgi:peptidoglycan/xylan/chitin deacetylase (PgdA/CDA1 family)
MTRLALVRKATKLAAMVPGLLTPRNDSDLVMLLYHRVGAGDREIDLPIEAFESQLAYLAEHEIVLRLEEALEGKQAGRVVATFDDGLRDFHEHALPLLVRYRIPAILYLATGFVDGEGPSNPSDEALSWSQLREAMSTGLITVGSHTHSHANLAKSDERLADEEMRRSKGLIESRLGVSCRHFAYPWSVASASAERAARRHFDTAALTWATNRRRDIDPYRLGRLPVLRNDVPLFFRTKVKGMLDSEALIYRLAGRGPWADQ